MAAKRHSHALQHNRMSLLVYDMTAREVVAEDFFQRLSDSLYAFACSEDEYPVDVCERDTLFTRCGFADRFELRPAHDKGVAFYANEPDRVPVRVGSLKAGFKDFHDSASSGDVAVRGKTRRVLDPHAVHA